MLVVISDRREYMISILFCAVLLMIFPGCYNPGRKYDSWFTDEECAKGNIRVDEGHQVAWVHEVTD